MLDIELSTYRKLKADLQAQYPDGGFVVIIGDKVLGVWEKRIDALRAGYEECGHVNFLLRRI